MDTDVSTLKILLILSPDQGSGFCVTGKVEAGYVQTGDRILALPPNETCTVKGTHCCVCAQFLTGNCIFPTNSLF